MTDSVVQPGEVVGRAPEQAIAGKYRVIRRLGEGGMGAVYEAEHMAIGKRVAVKVLRREHAWRSDVVERFRLEARAAAQIGHPNIVSILDLDTDPTDGSLYMVQELLYGVDLESYIAHSGRIDGALAIQIALPVLSALAAAHDRGVLHRDVKPANIFLVAGESGLITPKVIDFGIAKVLGEAGDTPGRTRDGALIGTLAYMSPEQLAGDMTIDARSDVWAMGVVLYEMLAGRCPFPPPAGVTQNFVALAEFVERVSKEPAPRIERLVPGIAPDLAGRWRRTARRACRACTHSIGRSPRRRWRRCRAVDGGSNRRSISRRGRRCTSAARRRGGRRRMRRRSWAVRARWSRRSGMVRADDWVGSAGAETPSSLDWQPPPLWERRPRWSS